MDLLEEKSLQSSLAVLEKEYDDSLNMNGELDERIFVNTEDDLLDARSFSGVTSLCSSSTKVC